MAFWDKARSDPMAESYVLYNTTLSDALDAIDAYKIADAQTQLAYAATLGGDDENGEYNPDKIETLAFDLTDNSTSIRHLSATPKCLSQDHVTLLQPMATFAAHQNTFLLSLLRMQVFGAWQSVLVQAKRKSPAFLAQKLTEPPNTTYAEYWQTLDGLHATIKNSRLCIIKVLIDIDPIAGMSALLSQFSPSVTDDITQWLAQNFADSSTMMEYKGLIPKMQLKFPAVKALLDKAEQAFKKNSKAGFKDLPDETEADLYQTSLESLNKVEQQLQHHQAAMLKIMPNNQEQLANFLSDSCIFSDRFQQIYGDIHAN